MKRFSVTVNGKKYDVVVEETKGGQTPVETAKADNEPSETSAPEMINPDSANGKTVNAPLTGSIVGVSVGVGDVITEGQVLVQIEALKLTNEVVSPYSGKVVAIYVKQGQQISSGAPMVSIE